ncbi:hypothetical protein TNCV_1674971 [Trichonephila clavipes]|nr:hypothetical protein TNCV_1674971 [Trichonephila clavipes]
MKDQLKQFCLLACVRMHAKLMLTPTPISALAEKWRLVKRKRYVIPSLQKQNLLLLCNERSGEHLSGQVNSHNTRTWSLENPQEVLGSQRDSPTLNVFVSYLGGKCLGRSFSEN